MDPTKFDYLKGAGIAQKEAQRRLKEMVTMATRGEAYGPRVGGSPDYMRAQSANEAAVKNLNAAPTKTGQLPAYKIQNPEGLKKVGAPLIEGNKELPQYKIKQQASPLTDEEKKKLLEARKQRSPDSYDGARRLRKDGTLVDPPPPQW